MLDAPVADVSDTPRAPHLDRRPLIVPAATLVSLGAGGVATLVGSPAIGDLLWALTAALVLVPLAIEVVRAL
ncbi:MAG TPA: hypothetical protein PKE32_10210, partial [Miltoncostaeaceae bacterium]|nr:hypothetical protein [Miltoncostaeaceae bacterium]